VTVSLVKGDGAADAVKAPLRDRALAAVRGWAEHIPCVGDLFPVQFWLICGPPLLVLAFVLWTRP